MEELIVADREFQEMAQHYKETGVDIEKHIEEYLRIMNSIIRWKHMQGATANALAAYLGKVEALQGQLGDVMKVLNKELGAYVRSIDEKDRHLY